MKTLAYAFLIQDQMAVGAHTCLLQTGLHARQRTTIQRQHRTPRLCEPHQRSDTATNTGDARHLRPPFSVKPDGAGVCELRHAGTAGTGVDQRQWHRLSRHQTLSGCRKNRSANRLSHAGRSLASIQYFTATPNSVLPSMRRRRRKNRVSASSMPDAI